MVGSQKRQIKLNVSLLPGEMVDALKPKEFPHLTDAELNKRYVQEGVRIVVEQARYPLNQILGMFTDTFEKSGKPRLNTNVTPSTNVAIDGTTVESLG